MFGHDLGHVKVDALILFRLNDLERAVNAVLTVGCIFRRLFRHYACC